MSNRSVVLVDQEGNRVLVYMDGKEFRVEIKVYGRLGQREAVTEARLCEDAAIELRDSLTEMLDEVQS